jgi:hypothetical protein
MGFITKSKSFNKEKQMKKKDVKTNCVTVRLTERQLIALQELSKSGVCERETLASAFQYLLNQHIILKKG